ncbi:bifunctional adenosylcobinamide kinase/adenosylcobinamide-phosphate guanylyltransferase [Yoonia sediminilitoris]|uniref:Bifunctional adenosylcobalamin biosynthesis protein n=1 Tax=Yoonia sediminilitoris TaxID=1286148 RepID=A0A2T6KPW8_9RHOB|nr:bifunctional adenosylcobinamide kinase/adenosylcobinamide-phosphate guanylyltransferase [Yoonia sediminilitoris]PUB18565.1 adenosylcobinamide kinase /adenosylcobinamide-phosphate guanylyltransferase [Yoonia sediminilitoris]RCW98733.1 adenosylcobinamide kinase /adenosylcobinamide-phosphate guanylyltransferase [Yoonia sediminilitoris]
MTQSGKLTLVLGGAASGKSAFAENLVLESNLAPLYVATAQISDDEMAEKKLRHQERRGTEWTTVEEPVAVADILAEADHSQVILIDCATLWLTNIILGDYDLAVESAHLVAALCMCRAEVVVVSNEVGQGIVPDNKLSRTFRDAQGTLNQSIATEADLVVAVMAGLPLALKGSL